MWNEAAAALYFWVMDQDETAGAVLEAFRRARNAGLLTRLGCHSFRATGITVYLLNGGLLEYAHQMAAHESTRTTKLYDHRNDQVERIVL